MISRVKIHLPFLVLCNWLGKYGRIFFVLLRGEDGSRQVEDHLVMYNNPLFTKRDQIKSSVSTRQLALDSEWNVVFDL